MTFDRDEISREVQLRRDLYELGAVNLDPPRGDGFGFERRQQSADRRPTARSAWGSPPVERVVPKDLPGRRGGPGR